MAKDDDGLLSKIGKYASKTMRERASARGKKMEEDRAAKAKADEEKAARSPAPAADEPVMGPGGYGGRRGVESQRRQIEQEERGEKPTTTGVSFKSSNQGQSGRMSATERKARDKRLNGVSI